MSICFPCFRIKQRNTIVEIQQIYVSKTDKAKQGSGKGNQTDQKSLRVAAEGKGSAGAKALKL